jgi:hypothetical protein
MGYVNPFNRSGIERRFNSQLPGSRATTVPCGITCTPEGTFGAISLIDFGFQGDNRFVQPMERPPKNLSSTMPLCCPLSFASSIECWAVHAAGVGPGRRRIVLFECEIESKMPFPGLSGNLSRERWQLCGR